MIGLLEFDPFPAPRPDVLTDHQAEELALVDRSIGMCAGLTLRDLSVESHRTVLAAIAALETAERPVVLGRLAAALAASNALSRYWRTVKDFSEWWIWITGHPRDAAPVDLVAYLRELSLLREGRHFFTRAAIAVERGELVEAEVLAERARKAVALLRTRKIARVA